MFQHPKYWLSLVWAGAILTRAKKEGKIKVGQYLKNFITQNGRFYSKEPFKNEIVDFDENFKIQ